MSVFAKSVTVNATAPVLLYDPSHSGSIGDKAGALLRFADSTATGVLYLIGDGNYTDNGLTAPSAAAARAAGFPVYAVDMIPSTIFQGEKIYGILDSSTADIRVIESGR